MRKVYNIVRIKNVRLRPNYRNKNLQTSFCFSWKVLNIIFKESAVVTRTTKFPYNSLGNPKNKLEKKYQIKFNDCYSKYYGQIIKPLKCAIKYLSHIK